MSAITIFIAVVRNKRCWRSDCCTGRLLTNVWNSVNFFMFSSILHDIGYTSIAVCTRAFPGTCIRQWFRTKIWCRVARCRSFSWNQGGQSFSSVHTTAWFRWEQSKFCRVDPPFSHRTVWLSLVQSPGPIASKNWFLYCNKKNVVGNMNAWVIKCVQRKCLLLILIECPFLRVVLTPTLR